MAMFGINSFDFWGASDLHAPAVDVPENEIPQATEGGKHNGCFMGDGSKVPWFP